MKFFLSKWSIALFSLALLFSVNLRAQTPPTITLQPVSQTNLVGSNVIFTIAVSGTGPFTYQWLFNGTNLPNNTIITVAGSGNRGFSGDGGQATNASMDWPSGVCVDTNGNMYIADLNNNRIRKVDTNGIITTIAGVGPGFPNAGSFGGDGGPATNANLYTPQGVGIDAANNLYIADRSNCRIRRVDANGIITTVAGTGNLSYSGDGGMATNASLYGPKAVWVNPDGTCYIADSDNNRIRYLDAYGKISTVAGTGSAGFNGDGLAATQCNLTGPSGVFFDLAATNLYIADLYNRRVRQVDANGVMQTVAGYGSPSFSGDGGVATKAGMNSPSGVAFSKSRGLYIADFGDNRIREVFNGFITTRAGDGSAAFSGDGEPAPFASLNTPYGVALDGAGNLYIADTANNRIRKIPVAGFPSLALKKLGGSDAGAYSVIVTSSFGSVTSLVATLTITSPPAIMLSSVSQWVGNGSNITLTASVSGAFPLICSWYFNGAILPNALDTSLVFTNFADENVGQYWLVVTNSYGSATSAPVVLTIGPPPSIVTQPASQYVVPGSNVTLNVTAAGDPQLTYLWYFHNTALLQAGPTSRLTISNFDVSDVGDYFVIITNVYARAGVMSQTAALGLALPIIITNQPVSQARLLGSNVAFSVGVMGAPPLTYQWQFFGTNLLNQTNASLSLFNITAYNLGDYTVAIGNPVWNTTSSVAKLTQAFPPCIAVQPQSQRGLPGDTMRLGVTATGTDPLKYLWYFNNSSLLQNSTNPVFTVSSLTNGTIGLYKVVVTNSFGRITSQVASLSYRITIDTQPSNQLSYLGSNTTFQVGASGGAGTLSYQWQFNGTNLLNVIYTIAGNGTQSSSGDGGLATNAGLISPFGLAVDTAGNIFIADELNNRIRKINTNGIIIRVAGNNTNAYSGDGGAATNANLNRPFGVMVDRLGNLYIADLLNNRIRKVDTNGLITTIAGNGTNLYAGDGGLATNASLASPRGLVFDPAGNLYITDSSHFCIRRIDTNGIILTMAGSGTNSFFGDGGPAKNAGISGASYLTINTAGDLFFSDPSNHRVRKIDTNGIITTVAGNGSTSSGGDGGSAADAGLGGPTGLALDALGNLYIADTTGARIRKVDGNGIITTVAGNGTLGFGGDGGPPLGANFRSPAGIWADASGNLIINDESNERVRRAWTYAALPTLTLGQLTRENVGSYNVVISDTYGSLTSSFASLTLLAPPWVVAQTPSLAVTNGTSANFSVTAADAPPFSYQWYFNTNTALAGGTNPMLAIPITDSNTAGNYWCVITNIYGSGTSTMVTLAIGQPPTIFALPTNQTLPVNGAFRLGVTATGYGPLSYQWRLNGSNIANNVITTVAGKGNSAFSGDGGPATNASLYWAQGVTFDPAGNMYIADNNNNRVRKVNTSGIISTIAGKGTNGFSGDGGAATNAGMYLPNHVAIDAQGNLYVSAVLDYRVRKIDANGVITTVAGTGIWGPVNDGGPATNASLHDPINVAFDGRGNWYICDLHNWRIRKVDTNGMITTVAGNGSSAFAGDGGPAVLASLKAPQGVSLDAAGNLLIADAFSARVRRVDTNGIITTIAGSNLGGYAGDGGPATNAGLSQPWYALPDAAGNVYIADHGDHRIRKVDAEGRISTLAGNGVAGYSGDGGSAQAASLNGPSSLALDAAGDLYIADWYNNRIRKVYLSGYPVLTKTNVGPANAGDYTIVVTGQFGSTTSSVANITVVVPPPQIVGSGSSFGFSTNHFGFKLSSVAGTTIVIDGSTNLVAWTPLFTNLFASSNAIYFFDPASTDGLSRFYRARSP